MDIDGYQITFNEFIEAVITSENIDPFTKKMASVTAVHEMGHDAIARAGVLKDAVAADLAESLIQDIIKHYGSQG